MGLHSCAPDLWYFYYCFCYGRTKGGGYFVSLSVFDLLSLCLWASLLWNMIHRLTHIVQLYGTDLYSKGNGWEWWWESLSSWSLTASYLYSNQHDQPISWTDGLKWHFLSVTKLVLSWCQLVVSLICMIVKNGRCDGSGWSTSASSKGSNPLHFIKSVAWYCSLFKRVNPNRIPFSEP